MRANTLRKTKKFNNKNHLKLVKAGTRKKVDVSYFKLLVFGSILVTVIALGQVIQYSFYNQYSLENDQLNKKIESYKQDQQELESKVLSLESPMRIEQIAKSQLKMDKPQRVGYMVYQAKDSSRELALKR